MTSLFAQATQTAAPPAADWVCAVWCDHPSLGETMTLEEYLALPHAVADFGLGTNTVEELAVRNDGLRLNVTVTYTGFSLLPTVLAGTKLVATIQRRLANVMMSGFPIRVLESPLELPRIHEMLYWHQRHEFEPGHMWLRKLMIEAAQNF